MKKIFVVLIAFALVFAACGDEDTPENGNGNQNGNNNGTTKTTLTINNMSSYNLLSVEYSSVDFGNINSGKDITKTVSPGTRYVFFSLRIANEQVQCRTTQALTCDEGENNQLTLTNNSSVTTTLGEMTNTLKSIVDKLSTATTLNIKNMSDYNLLNVEYSVINFGNINSGKDTTKTVSAETRNIFFYIQSLNGNVRCRTDFITTEENTGNVYLITNNTIITTTINETTNTLKSIYELLNKPNAPDISTVLGLDRSARVIWTGVEGATSYRVYCSTSIIPPYTPIRTTTETSTTITDLVNDTTYYIWLQAVNSYGVSNLNDSVQVIPTTNFTANSRTTFTNAIEAFNYASGGTYTITVTGNFAQPQVVLRSGASKKIIIKGDTVARSISNEGPDDFFIIESGITLELKDNITLNGNNKIGTVVWVQPGGEFIMNDGSIITGARDSGVFSEGTFTMYGGTITGNNKPYDYYWQDGGGVFIGSGIFTMNGGTISNNIAEDHGGGVAVAGGTFVMNNGSIIGNKSDYGGGVAVGGTTFTMKGGLISNNNGSSYGGGVFVDSDGSFIKTGGTIDNTNSNNINNRGKVAFASNGNKRRETAAGPENNMNSSVSGTAGGWE